MLKTGLIKQTNNEPYQRHLKNNKAWMSDSKRVGESDLPATFS
jgi:hypothetical protein